MEQKKVWFEYVILFSLFIVALVPMTSAALTDNALRLGLLVVVIGIVLRCFDFKNTDKKIILFAFLYWFALLLSACFNPNMTTGLKLVWQRVLEMLPFFILVIVVKQKKYLYWLLAVFLGAMLLANVYYIWQFCTKSVLVGGAIGNRPSGFYWEDWFMQIFLVLTIPVCTIALDQCKEKLSFFKKFFLAILLTLSLVASIMSFARGLWLAVAVFFLFYGFYRLYSQKKVLVAIFITVTFLLFLGYHLSLGFQQRVDTLTDLNFSSNSHRLLAWKSSWDMFSDHKLLGVGQGNWYSNYLEKYIYHEEIERLPNAHSNYMQILAETGILGMMTYLMLVGYILFLALCRLKQAKSSEERFGALLMFFAMFNFLFIGLMGDFIDTRTLVETLWFIIGIAYLFSQEKRQLR